MSVEHPSKEPVTARITRYLMAGGLFNPELANHEAVRDLLVAARDEISQLNRKLREAEHDAREDARAAAVERSWQDRQGEDYGSY